MEAIHINWDNRLECNFKLALWGILTSAAYKEEAHLILKNMGKIVLKFGHLLFAQPEDSSIEDYESPAEKLKISIKDVTGVIVETTQFDNIKVEMLTTWILHEGKYRYQRFIEEKFQQEFAEHNEKENQASDRNSSSIMSQLRNFFKSDPIEFQHVKTKTE